MMIGRLVLGGSLLLALVPAERADACSPPPCAPGAFTPPAAATVPANAPGFYWRATVPAGGSVDVSKATLVRTDAPGDSIPFTVESLGNGGYLIVPTSGLVAGTYVLTDTTVCSEGYHPDVSTSFTVGAAAALPTALGALTETANSRTDMNVGTVSGSCTSEIDAAQSVVELTADASAAPWLPLLHFTTLLDGQPWNASAALGGVPSPGATWQGRGKDKIFVSCASEDSGAQTGTTEGTHTVTFEARLPGTSTVLTSSTITVDLECEPGTGSGSGSGSDDEGDDEHASDGGCSTSGSGAGFALVGLALVIAARRRLI